MKLQSQTILITGGSSGIGLEMVKQLTKLDNTILIIGRNIEKLEEAKRQYPNINIYQGDVSNKKDIEKLYKEISKDFPQLNILINNAGIMRMIDFKSSSYMNICDEIDTNLKAPIIMTQKFLPLLSKQKEAAIINVTSGLAFVPFEQTPLYSTSKAGLHTYTKLLRKQLKHTKIKVFELAPPKTSLSLIDKNVIDNKNKMPTMDVSDVVSVAIKNIQKDKYEILPELSKLLKFVGKIQL